MSASILTAPPGPVARFRTLLVRLAEFGTKLACTIAVAAQTDHAATDPALRAAALAPTIARIGRISRALYWLDLLRQVFAGAYRPAPPPAARATRDTAPARPLNPSAGRRVPPATRVTAAMRRTFATRPIGKTVQAICDDLDITPDAQAWPAELIALTQTPAEWSVPQDAPEDTPITAAKPPRAPNPHHADRDARKLRATWLRRLARPKTGHDPP